MVEHSTPIDTNKLCYWYWTKNNRLRTLFQIRNLFKDDVQACGSSKLALTNRTPYVGTRTIFYMSRWANYYLFFCFALDCYESFLEILTTIICWTVQFRWKCTQFMWMTTMINRILCIHLEKCSFNCFRSNKPQRFMCKMNANECGHRMGWYWITIIKDSQQIEE